MFGNQFSHYYIVLEKVYLIVIVAENMVMVDIVEANFRVSTLGQKQKDDIVRTYYLLSTMSNCATHPSHDTAGGGMSLWLLRLVFAQDLGLAVV